MDLGAIEWPPQHPGFASLPTPDVAHHVLVVVVSDGENDRSMEKLYVEVAGTADFFNTTYPEHLCRAVHIRCGFALRRRLAFLRIAHVSVCGSVMVLIQAKHVFTA